jgi:hypothetical protein
LDPGDVSVPHAGGLVRIPIAPNIPVRKNPSLAPHMRISMR